MSDKEETVAPEDFVDPNSGRAAQPGAFASMGVQPEPGGEDGAGANVPENDPEQPAKNDSDAVPEVEGIDNGEDPGAASETEDDNVSEGNVVPENAPENLAGQVDPDAEGGQELEAETEGAPTEGEGPAADADAQSQSQPEGEGDSEEKDYSDVLSGSIPDVEKYINEHPDEKDAVIAAEKQGQGRKGILNL